jgi:hypothetical protein
VNKAQAVIVIVYDKSNPRRPNKTGRKEVERACKTLGMSEHETHHILYHLDYERDPPPSLITPPGKGEAS